MNAPHPVLTVTSSASPGRAHWRNCPISSEVASEVLSLVISKASAEHPGSGVTVVIRLPSSAPDEQVLLHERRWPASIEDPEVVRFGVP